MTMPIYLLFLLIPYIVALNMADSSFNIYLPSLPFNFSEIFINNKSIQQIVALTDFEIYNSTTGDLGLMQHNQKETNIPDTFDARKTWKMCEDLIGAVPDQGNCTSGWAFSTTSVMTDRICINSYGQNKKRVSPEDLLSCCLSCREYVNGCFGGSVIGTWRFWETRGIVSGEFYKEEETKLEGCKSYSTNSFIKGVASMCQYNCTNTNYTKKYFKDKIRGLRVYHIQKEVDQIQLEIIRNGPVVAKMKVYVGFVIYSDGIYFNNNKRERVIGYHFVKLIGWGRENGTDYWLGVNSWGSSWGNNGTFKILRGQDECGIESSITAGKSTKKLEDGESFSGFDSPSVFPQIVLIVLILFVS